MNKIEKLKKELIKKGFSESDVKDKHFKTLEKMLNETNTSEEVIPKTEINEVPITRPKRKEIDKNELVPVLNCTNGTLVYISKKTGAEYRFSEFGGIEYLEVSELTTMKSSQPKFLNEPWLIIMHDDVVDYLGLTKLYEKIIEPKNIESIFKYSDEKFGEVIKQVPSGIKQLIISKAMEKLRNKTFYSLPKKELIEETFNVKLEV
jgi:hypothetical protein